jgi:hypothetical protein
MTLILYLIAAAKRCSDISGLEVPLLTLAWQAAGYLVAMGVANLCYNHGRCSRRALGGKTGLNIAASPSERDCGSRSRCRW